MIRANVPAIQTMRDADVFNIGQEGVQEVGNRAARLTILLSIIENRLAVLSN